MFGFTIRFPRKSLVLSNEIQISEVYDPFDESNNPPRKTYISIWDTGATGSVITKKVVDELGLKPSGKITVQVVGQSDAEAIHEVNTYLVNLFLPPNLFIDTKASEGSLGGCDILIGMDVISLGDFAVTNYNNKTTWSFRYPSCEEIDFVKEIDKHNKKFPSPEQRRKERNKRKSANRRNK